MYDSDSSPTRKETVEGDLQGVFERRVYSSDKTICVAGCAYRTVLGISVHPCSPEHTVDFVEIRGAYGYLFHSFLSQLSNTCLDVYGPRRKVGAAGHRPDHSFYNSDKQEF